MNSHRTALRLLLCVLCLASASAAQNGFAWTDVIGLKTCGTSPPLCAAVASAVPTHLYVVDVTAGTLADRGVVTLGGAQIDVDGLALSPAHGLLGFSLSAGTSALIALDAVTATATAIGPALSREIRGAAFDAGGDLWVYDAMGDSVLRVDPVTGLEVGAPVALTLGGQSFGGHNIADLAFDASDAAHLSVLDQVYDLDLATGALTQIRQDPGECYAGLAFRANAPAGEVIAYEVCGTDDIFSLDLAPPATAMTTVIANLIPSYNAGRGDLASLPDLTVLAACQSRNGSGVNPAGYTCSTLPKIGTTWLSSVALVPATTGTVVALTVAPPIAAVPFPFGSGELLISLAPSPMLLTGVGNHALSIPALNVLIGFPVTSQGFRLDAVSGSLVVVPQNALDLTIGL